MATTATTTTGVTGAVQEQVLETIELGHKAVLEGVRTWAETVNKLIPEVPAASWNKELPSLEDTVDNAFDFASKLIDSQRQFAKDVIAATRPVARRTTEGVSEAADQATASVPYVKETATKR